MYFSLPNGEIELSNYQIKKLSEKSTLSTSNFRTYIIFYFLKRVHWIDEHAKPTICWNDVSHCWLMDHIGLSLVLSSSLLPLLLMCLKKLIICTFRLKWQSHIQDFFGRLVFGNFHKLYSTRVDANYDFLLAETEEEQYYNLLTCLIKMKKGDNINKF